MNRPGTDTLVLLHANRSAACHVIGSKADSLQQVMAFGLPVPPAFVLPTGFFQPWCDAQLHELSTAICTLYQRDKQAFGDKYGGAFGDALSLGAFERRHGPPAITHIIDVDMPALGIGMAALRLKRRKLPAPFLAAWDKLMVDYGCRGPGLTTHSSSLHHIYCSNTL